ncbi:MAG: 50S ribosomal protein L25 [Anaerolineales bacterium]|nr:50S ribosomal protein L25 [Anaerolineales bacterium]
MEDFYVKATRRTLTGKKVNQLRTQGKTPAIIYGRTVEKPIAITLDRLDLAKVLRKASYSSLITIDLEGEKYSALVRDFQMDKILGDLTHVDFLAVSLTDKVRTEVRIILEGKAPVVTNLNGMLVTGLETVEVESLPQDLPDHFVVDVSTLAEYGDTIFVRDLVAPANVEILSDPDELIVVSAAPAVEETSRSEGLAPAAEAEKSEE